MSPASPARIAPSPPGIRITLARGAFGRISTAREPPTLTVSSAMAGEAASAANSVANPKQLAQRRFVMVVSCPGLEVRLPGHCYLEFREVYRVTEDIDG